MRLVTPTNEESLQTTAERSRQSFHKYESPRIVGVVDQSFIAGDALNGYMDLANDLAREKQYDRRPPQHGHLHTQCTSGYVGKKCGHYAHACLRYGAARSNGHYHISVATVMSCWD